MSSEQLGSGENVLKGNLGGAWDIKHGYAGAYTDLGIARRFGGAAAAYSLRDIGAMNGEVVRVRREPHDTGASIDDEEKFSANQVSSGALEDWVNGKLETKLPADVAQASAAYSLRKVSEGRLVYTGDFSSDANNIAANTTGITVTGNNDGIFTKNDVLKVENDAAGVPQLGITSTPNYTSSSSGIVEFEYYVPSTHPIVGNFWHIGTNRTAAGTEEIYTKEGVKIVGDAWTTVKLFYGSLYGGVDKPTTSGAGGGRLITILDQQVADGDPVTIPCQDGDVYYISSLTIKTYDGKAVSIRRSSDATEVDVHFDSDNKVSTNSSISVVRPPTSATTLEGYLNEVLTVGVAVEGGNGSDRPDSFTNATNSSFTATVTEVAGGYFPYNTNLNDVIVVSFDIVLTGSASPSLTTSNGVNTVQNRSNSETISSSGSFTKTLTCDQNGGTATHIRFADSDDGTFAVTNFRVVSHTHQAFVHTWYDQAGLKDASQLTADNQPKIASSGALLADGIEFDGSASFLDTSVVLGATSTIGIFTVVKPDNTDADGFILDSRIADNNGARLQQSNADSGKYLFSMDTTDVSSDSGSVSADETLVTAIQSSTAATLFKNAVQLATAADDPISGIGFGYRIGANLVSTGTYFDGTMKEIILFTSDQTDNRFKIESNINNHYGLYNDENEFSADAQVSGTGSTVSNASRTGGTLTLGAGASGTNHLYFQLQHLIPAGTTAVFVSFDFESSDNSVALSNIKTRDDGLGPRSGNFLDVNNNTTTVQNNGFYGGKLKSFSTDGSTRLSFATSHTTEGYTFTISNLKFSFVSRNGLVETWYDQSDSGNNATQATANNQPTIVENGGQCKSNGSPSVFFKGDTTDDQLDFTDLTLTDAIIFTVVNIDSSADQQIILGGSVGTGNGVMMPMMDNGSSTTQVYKNSTVGGAEQGSSQFINGAAVTLADRDDAFDNLAVNTQILFTMVDVDVAEAKTLDGISRTPSDATSFHLQGQMNELIIYNSDLSSDRGTIESEIANHYNITLS